MEPQGTEIYSARIKTALESLNIPFEFDGRFTLDVYGTKVKIDVSATAPELVGKEIITQVYLAGSRDGYGEYKRKLKELIG